MLENGRGLIKALENWAKKVTTGYKDVNVRDLSTSFRDGMAFCAIIHHYRPDLIDFESLSRENIFENNSLAFSVAEKQLGVPALLDAEDMVTYTHPDRLSIITYLSQLRNCFENQNKVNKKPELKRIQKNSFGPPSKVPIIEPSLTSAKRHEVCQVCKHRVFILERLIVDRKLYHTTCFRCHKCNTLLNPGAYVESDTPGIYECSVCLIDETSDNSESCAETSGQEKKYEVSDVRTQVSKSVVTPEIEFTSKEAVNFAKSNLSQENYKPERSSIFLHPFKSPDTHSEVKKSDTKVSEINISVKDKIHAFEKNQVNEKPPLPTSPVITSVPKLSHSTISNSNNEYSNLTDRFSIRQSLVLTKNLEKGDKEAKKECVSSKDLPAKGLVLKKELCLDENSVNGKFVKDLSVETKEDNSDSITNTNTSLCEVHNADSEMSSNGVRSLNNESSIFSVK